MNDIILTLILITVMIYFSVLIVFLDDFLLNSAIQDCFTKIVNKIIRK